jgi:hypothetical protein
MKSVFVVWLRIKTDLDSTGMTLLHFPFQLRSAGVLSRYIGGMLILGNVVQRDESNSPPIVNRVGGQFRLAQLWSSGVGIRSERSVATEKNLASSNKVILSRIASRCWWSGTPARKNDRVAAKENWTLG